MRVEELEKATAAGQLEQQCSQQLTTHKEELARCYSTSNKPIVSFRFGVAKSGKTTGEVLGAPPNVRECLQTVVSTFAFSPFDTEEALHLSMIEFPRCRVREISRLYP